MNTRVISADRLTTDQIRTWSCAQRADGAVSSPFFRPEFTQAVAAVRDNVEVAVLEEAGRPVGFFPFQRIRGGVLSGDWGTPVAEGMCDIHGMIVREGVESSAEQLVRDCGLLAWRFDNVIASQTPFQPYHWIRWNMPYMHLADGLDGYLRTPGKGNSSYVRRVLRNRRKIEREVAPLRFVPHTTDRQVLRTLIDWKVQQYRRLGTVNCLSPAWRIELIESLLAIQGEAFSPMLSALYAGDHLAAILLSLRSYGTLHGWYCAYNRDLRRYSPGIILLLEIAKAAPKLGLSRLNLGRGHEPYKLKMMSGWTAVAEGAVDFRLFKRTLRRGWLRTREWVRSSPLEHTARRAYRHTRSWLGLSR